VYYEACREREEAIRRERYLKRGRGKRYRRQRLGVELVALTPFEALLRTGLSRNKLERH